MICIIDVFFFIDPEQGKKVGAQTAGHGKKCKFSCLFFCTQPAGYVMNAHQEHVANFFICGRSYLAEKAGRDYMAELVRYSNEHRVVPLRTARLAAENV